MSSDFKKIFYSIFLSVFLIYCFNGLLSSYYNKVIISLMIPFFIFNYFEFVYSSDSIKVDISLLFENNFLRIFKILFFTIITIISMENYTPPKNDFVVKVFENYKLIFIILFIYFLQKKIITCISSKSFINVNFEEFFDLIFIFLISIWFFGFAGDNIYNYYLNESENFISISMSFFVVFVVFKIFLSPIREEGNLSSSKHIPDAKMKEVKEIKEMTEKDKDYISIHEAGHALVFSCLSSLPKDFKMVVNNKTSDILGYVSFFDGKSVAGERSYTEWLMLVYLAGNFAEEYYYNNSTMGACSDNDKWCYIAKKYLKNGYRGVYYSNPSNVFEHNENQSKIESLKCEQIAILKEFFEKNETLLIELSKLLLKKKTLNKDQVLEIINKVSLVNCMPFLKVNC